MSLDETVSKIVRQAVNELLQKKEKLTSPAAHKKVLIVITDESHAAEVKQIIHEISTFGRPTLAYCGEGAFAEYETFGHADIYPNIRLASHGRSGWVDAAKQSDIVVIPTISIGTIIKISTLIDDDPASGVIVNALINGKDIVLCRSNILPAGAQKLYVPPAVLDVISTHIQQLSKFGIHVVYTKQLVGRVKALYYSTRSSRRPLIHAKHVRDWVNEGETQIALSPHVLVTPLAKEEAKLLGLELGGMK